MKFHYFMLCFWTVLFIIDIIQINAGNRHWLWIVLPTIFIPYNIWMIFK